VDTVGSKASSAFSIRSSRKSQDTGEYKMSGMFGSDSRELTRRPLGTPLPSLSHPRPPEPQNTLLTWRFTTVVNDSGVYLPVCCTPKH
jgi:hypothetical protein